MLLWPSAILYSDEASCTIDALNMAAGFQVMTRGQATNLGIGMNQRTGQVSGVDLTRNGQATRFLASRGLNLVEVLPILHNLSRPLTLTVTRIRHRYESPATRLRAAPSVRNSRASPSVALGCRRTCRRS